MSVYVTHCPYSKVNIGEVTEPLKSQDVNIKKKKAMICYFCYGTCRLKAIVRFFIIAFAAEHYNQ